MKPNVEKNPNFQNLFKKCIYKLKEGTRMEVET